MGQKGSAEPTMAEVARRAGVSIATVSRALRGQSGVGAATRERILAIAEELAYVVSPEASSLSRRSTGRVAVVVPKVDSWFYSSMLAAIEAEVRAADVDLLVYQVEGRAERGRFFRELPARRKVDAVILTAFPVPADEAERLHLMGVHVVIAGGRLLDHPHVRVDDDVAGATATRHLLALGHRRIAMLGTDDAEGLWWSIDAERFAGYRRALGEAGIELDPDLVPRGEFGAASGMQEMATLLELADPPTAVFAYSDEMAIGALSHLARAGIDVPGQISVIGVDDHPLASIFDLSTINQSVRLQGQLAGRMALDLISGRPIPSREVVVPLELVERGSTGPVPA
jgi:LacI family repressor for deo operon, udp, cdd, tsx, nupC, and nupG